MKKFPTIAAAIADAFANTWTGCSTEWTATDVYAATYESLDQLGIAHDATPLRNPNRIAVSMLKDTDLLEEVFADLRDSFETLTSFTEAAISMAFDL